jgi:thiamine pyrophosphokinase
MGPRTVIVVAGGGALDQPTPEPLPADATVIAADGGIDRALALGLPVDAAIGDFDSVTAAGLAAVEAAGARIERYPAAKDATDLELALDAAIALGPERILVVGSGGGRLDHLLGSLLLIGDERYAGATVDAWLGAARAYVIRRARTISGAPGDVLSLLPLHGPAGGVTTDGLEYPLHGETLPPGTSRGTSNVFAAGEAHITVERGCLLALRPAPDCSELA